MIRLSLRRVVRKTIERLLGCLATEKIDQLEQSHYIGSRAESAVTACLITDERWEIFNINQSAESAYFDKVNYTN